MKLEQEEEPAAAAAALKQVHFPKPRTGKPCLGAGTQEKWEEESSVYKLAVICSSHSVLYKLHTTFPMLERNIFKFPF